MTCLNDAQIQAVADREAAGDLRMHAASCPRCGDRVRQREAMTAGVLGAISPETPLPPQLARRVEAALAGGRGSGATRLRAAASERPPRRRAFWSGVVAVAATIIAVLFIAPAIRESTTVSAADVLAASADRLAQPVTAGIEVLDYELVLDGVPRELMPDHANGAYRIKQVIDHDTKGRFRFTSYTADGQLLSSIAQDPAQGRRVMLIRLEDQAYRFDFTMPATPSLSLPEMERLHMQASVALMQASGDQLLQLVDTPSGKAYRIEVPKVTAPATNAVWDLSEAQVLVDAADYRILELAVKGAFLQQPYSISFRLLQRDIKANAAVPAGDFEVPDTPGAIAFTGEGTAMPARDALVAALQEMTRMKQAR